MKPTKTLFLFLATSIVRRSRRARWSRSLGSLNLIFLVLAATGTPATADDNTWTNGLANFSWTDGVPGNWAPFTWGNGFVDSAFFNAAGAGTVTLGSAITAKGVSFTANGYTINGGANVLTLAANGAGSLTNGQINVNAAVSATINAVIGGSVGLTKTGTGTLTLAGANTYTGATVVSGGILEAGSNTALGTTANGTTVASGTSLRLANGVNLGNEALTLNGSGFPGQEGALCNVISGVSTCGGPITLASSSDISPSFGTMTLNGPVTISDTTLSFSLGANPGKVNVNGAITGNAVGYNDNISVANGGSTGGVNLNTVNTYLGTTSIGGGSGATGTILNANVANALPTVNGRTALDIFVNGGSGTLNIGGSAGFPLGASQAVASLVGDSAAKVTLGANTLTIGFGSGVNTNGTANANFAGAISGTGSLAKDGTSTQILSGTSTFTGAVNVNGGILTITNSAALGVGPKTVSIISSGNTRELHLNASGPNIVLPANISFSTTNQSGTVFNDAGNNTIQGNVTMVSGFNDTVFVSNAGTLTLTGTLTPNIVGRVLRMEGASDGTISGSILDGGFAPAVTKNGAGTWTLSGANTYTGVTLISGGTLQVGAGGTTGTLGSGAVTNNATLIFNRSDALTQSAAIGGTGSVSQIGGGTLTLSGANAFTGAVNVNSGALTITNSAALGVGPKTVTISGNGTTSLRLNAAGPNIVLPADLSFETTNLSGTVFNDTGNNTIQGNVTMISGNFDTVFVSNAGTLTLSGTVTPNTSSRILRMEGASDGTISGAILDGGFAPAVTKNGTGTWTLSGANTYTGSTNINGGTLQVGAGGTTGSLGTGAVTNNATLIFNRSNALTQSAVIGGTGSLAQIGGGTLTLSGTNGFTGPVNVSSGALTITNSAALGVGPKTVTINGGGTTSLRLNPAGPNIVLPANLSFSTTNSVGTVFNDAGNNTIQGNVTMVSGFTDTVLVSNAGTLTLTGTVTPNVVGRILRMEGASDGTISGAILDGGFAPAVTKNGAGIWTLSGANTYTGGTNINAGTLALANAGAIGATGAITFAGGTLQHSASNGTDYSGRFNPSSTDYRIDTNGVNVTYGSAMTGGASLTKLGVGSLVLTGTNTYTGSTVISGGTLQVGAGGATGTLGSGAVTNNAALTFNRSNALTQSAAIDGTGSVSKNGGGTLTLSGTNGFTGPVNVNSGALTITNSAALGTGPKTVTINGSGTTSLRLNPAGPNIVLPTNISLSTTNDVGTVFNDAGNNTIQGNVTMIGGFNDTVFVSNAGTLTLTGTLTPNVGGRELRMEGASDGTISGAILDGGFAPAVTKNGAGTWTLSGANTYTGVTTISSGTLQVGAGGTTGTLGSGAVTNNATLVFNRSNALTQSAAINGTGSLAQIGGGTLTLSGTNGFTGPVNVSSGAITITNSAALGTGPKTVTINGGGTTSLRLNSAGPNIVLPANLSFSTTNTSGTIFNDAGNNTIQGNVTMIFGNNDTVLVSNADTLTLTGTVTPNVANRVLRMEGASDGTISGAILDGGFAPVVTKNGTGTWTLSGANTFTGGTNINGGTLALGNAAALGATGAITFAGGTLQHSASNGTDYSGRFNPSSTDYRIDTNGVNVTYGSAMTGGASLTKLGVGSLVLTGTNTYTGSTVINDGTLQVGAGGATGTLGSGAVTNNAALTFNRSNALTQSAAIDGTGSVSQIGGGTLTLSGTNGFTGPVNVSSGALTITNSAALGTGPKTVTINGFGTTSLRLNPAGPDIVLPANLSFETTNSAGTVFNDAGNNTIAGNVTMIFGNDNTVFVSNAGTLTLSGTLTPNVVGRILRMEGASDGTISGAILDGGFAPDVTKNGAGTWTLSGANTYTGVTLISGGTLRVGAGGTTGTLGSGAVTNNATLIFNRSDALTQSAVIDGTGSVSQIGGGTLTLSGTNGFTGPVNVNSGALTITNSAALGTGPKTVTINGGATTSLRLNPSGPSIVLPANLSFSTTNFLGTIFNDAGNNTIAGNVTMVVGFNDTVLVSNAGSLTLSGTVTPNVFNRILRMEGASDGTISGAILDGGFAPAVTKNGTGTWTLTSANTYSGPTTISGGTLSLGNVSALANTSGITIAGGARLSTSTDAITIGAPITLGLVATTSTVAFSRSISAAGSLTLNGVIGGAGNLTFTTPNVVSGNNLQTINLGAASNYGGNTTITTGNINNTVTVKAGVANALPVTTVLTMNGGAGTGTGRTVTYDLNGHGQALAGLTNATGLNLRNQRVTNTGALATLTVNNSANFAYGGTVVGTTTTTSTITGAIALTKSGVGTLTLTGPNSYTDATSVNAGTLALGASDVLPNGSAVSIGTATLNAATFTDTVGTLDATGSAVINLGAGAALAFADSSAIAWTGGTLNLTGTFVSGSSLRFGTTSGGLTALQLASISATGFSSFALDGSGFLTAISGYSTWAAINAIGSTPGQDKDGDGVSNAVEFVLGGTVLTNDLSKLPAVSTSGGNLLFTFMRSQASIGGSTIVTIEVGTTLLTWPDSFNVPGPAQANVPGVTIVKNTSVGFDTVTLSVPRAPDARKFARLNVVVTP